MTNKRILQIIREEVAREEGLLFEGMTYVPQKGYRNINLLIEADSDGETWDTVQNVLGYAGFIPVVGDVIDAINGLIYFMRNKIIDGMFAFVAAIPGVGSTVAKGIKTVYSKVGKKFANIFGKLFKDGKGAGVALFNYVSKAGGWVQQTLAPMFNKFKDLSSGIATLLGKFKFQEWNNTVLKYTAGWIGAPTWAMKALDGFVGQLKAFFTHMANPPSALVHVTQKTGETVVKSTLTKDEKESIINTYKNKVVKDEKLKTKYPTVNDYLDAQLALKNKKSQVT